MWRLLCRYKVFFLVGIIIFGIQIFLAYKSLSLNSNSDGDTSYLSQYSTADVGHKSINGAGAAIAQDNSVSDDEDSVNPPLTKKRHAPNLSSSSQAEDAHVDTSPKSMISAQQLGFTPPCDIHSKDAISALQRAKTKDCRQHIAEIACAIQRSQFYATHLPSFCPRDNHTANAQLGCYRDEKEFRLLSGYFVNFKAANTPDKCVQLCLQSGFPYAGVQYGTECFCGSNAPADSTKLPDSTCNMKCSGDPHEICGGYYAMNIYETGISSKYTHTYPYSIKKILFFF